MKVKLFLFVFLCLVCAADEDFDFEQILNELEGQVSWKIEKFEDSMFKGWTREEMKSMAGAEVLDPPSFSIQQPLSLFGLRGSYLPENFVYTEKWPECAPTVRQQGKCGGCWGFCTTGALADRQCIATQGRVKVTLSAQELISCDKTYFEQKGCGGGVSLYGFYYAAANGLVTSQCCPYESIAGVSPKCGLTERKCPADTQDDIFPYAKFYALKESSIYKQAIFAKNPDSADFDAIKAQIYHYGPVTATFTAYVDFWGYRGDVYKHKSNDVLATHCVEVIGWGKEEQTGVQYWVAVNSWGEGWGNKGHFKIQMGECEFEQFVTWAMPKLQYVQE